MKPEDKYSSHPDPGRVKKKESFGDIDDQNRNIAGMTSSILNVANQIIGAGILTIPYMVHETGVYGSLIMLLFSFGLSLLSAHFLAIAADYTHKDTYGGIATELFNSFLAWFSDLALTVFNFGTSVSYSIILYDQLDDLLLVWFGLDASFLAANHLVHFFCRIYL